MKKKLISYFSISLFFIFFILGKVNAQVADCRNFVEDIEKFYHEYNLGLSTYINKQNYGIELKQGYSKKKDEFEYIKDKDGFYSVGKIIDPELYQVVSINDKLIAINGSSLKNLSDKEILSKISFNKEKKISLKLKNQLNSEYSVDLKLKNFKHINKILTLDLKNLKVDEKNGTFEAFISLNFLYDYNDKSKLVQIAENNLSFFDNDEKFWDTIECNFSLEEWRKLRMPFPEVNFENRIDYNQNLIESYVNIYPFLKKSPYYDSDSLEVSFIDNGVMKFTNEFNLNNFPFDRQKLNIQIINKTGIHASTLRYSDYSARNVVEFFEKTNIPGWELINSEVYYDLYKNPNSIDGFITDIINIDLILDRKHGYYIYKVIFPIILILSVCWAAVWINPKELESRLTITIVCLLSLIAYNFVIDAELPKLEYLTTLDIIILISYIYATIPNFLSVISFQNLTKKRKKVLLIEQISKKYGLLSYVSLIFLVIFINVNDNPETAGAFAWLVLK